MRAKKGCFKEIADIHGKTRFFTIIFGIAKDGFKRGVEYEIMLVPNVVNITYGRGVGYVFEEETFEESVEEISATQIRQKMREEGELE